MNKIQHDDTQFLLYQTSDGDIRIETRMQNETVWLTINQMAELFGIDKSGISRHLKNIYETRELDKNSVVAIFATTAKDGKIYQVEYYNLDAIISVGYRVNSIRGTQFRIWATQRLREYIIKGFVMDDDRLKNAGGGNYFDELLSRIREFVLLKKYSGAKYWIFMQPVLIMIKMLKHQRASLESFRIKCIGPLMAILQQKSFIIVRMQINLTWV